MKVKFFAGLLLVMLIPQLVMAQAGFLRGSKEELMFEMTPGETLSATVKVINSRSEPQNLELYATDGVITPTGSFATTSKYDKQNHVGLWVKFSEPSVQLEANETKTLSFTISTPSDVTPGIYSGGLSMQPIPAVKTEALKMTGAITTLRVSTPVYVKIKGEKITNYSLDSFNHQYEKNHNFSFDFKNDGNTLLKVVGNIEISNITGETSTISIGDISLLKNSKQTSSVNWDQKPFWGVFTATAKLTVSELDLTTNSFNEVGQLEKTISFTVIPWTLIFIVLTILVLLLIVMIVMKINLKLYLKKCVPYSVADGETLMSIAKKNKQDWRKLAKINGLKAPFELSPGQKIMLPPKK